jgi:hypothetical protein
MSGMVGTGADAVGARGGVGTGAAGLAVAVVELAGTAVGSGPDPLQDITQREATTSKLRRGNNRRFMVCEMSAYR